MDARLIIDEPAPGSWNMAVDEVLYRGVETGGRAVIRIYRWSQPTLSLGYFQIATDREEHAPSRTLPMVRRATGGGAIVHDHELTYSLSLPLADDRPKVARVILTTVHESLAKFLRDVSVPVSLWRDVVEDVRYRPFLCFLRRSANDLVIGTDKVVGSAQRRRRHALLQHGSILLRRSLAAPELAGIEDNVHASGLADQLLECWPKRLAAALGLAITKAALTPAERTRADLVANERFAADQWTKKR